MREHFRQGSGKISRPRYSNVVQEGIPLQWVEDTLCLIAPLTQRLLCKVALRISRAAATPSRPKIGSVVPLENQEETASVWSTIFPVAKNRTDKLRGCIDLQTITPCLKHKHFKMEGTHTLAQVLRRRDWMTK